MSSRVARLAHTNRSVRGLGFQRWVSSLRALPTGVSGNDAVEEGTSEHWRENMGAFHLTTGHVPVNKKNIKV